MRQHAATTAGTIRWRVVSFHGQTGIVRMELAPLTLVARLGPTIFTGSRARPNRRCAAKAITGGRLGGVATVLIKAVLGNTVQQLMYQLVGRALTAGVESFWVMPARMQYGRDQTTDKGGSRDDRFFFPVKPLSVNGYLNN